MLDEKNIDITAAYRISNWKAILDDIYRDTYEKSSTIRKHVSLHAFLNECFFGNIGLLLILYKECTYDDLIRETLDIKKRIRSIKRETKDGTISIYINLNLDKQCLPILSKKEKDNIFLSYLHCPDTEQQYVKDFKVLYTYLKDEKKLSKKDIGNIVKYHSYYKAENINYERISYM